MDYDIFLIFGSCWLLVQLYLTIATIVALYVIKSDVDVVKYIMKGYPTFIQILIYAGPWLMLKIIKKWN